MVRLVVDKIMSARFLMAIIFSVTSCAGFLLGKMPIEAFMTLAGVVVHAYFQKSRPHENPLR